MLCVSLQGHVTHCPGSWLPPLAQIPVFLWGNGTCVQGPASAYPQAPPQMISPDGLLPEASLCMQGPSLPLSQSSQSNISTSSGPRLSALGGSQTSTSLPFHGTAYIHCLFEQTSHIPSHVAFPLWELGLSGAQSFLYLRWDECFFLNLRGHPSYRRAPPSSPFQRILLCDFTQGIP